MKLTVLGKYGPFPAPMGACSGYLVESGSASLVLDLGSGTLGRLRSIKPDIAVDAIILTHLHSDHMSDMLVLRYALEQLKARGINVPMPLSVVSPPEPQNEFRQLSASGVYNMLAAADGMKLKLNDMSIMLHRMTHPAVSYAVSIQCGAKRLVYTGDTGYNMMLDKVCEGADLLLADTCFLSADKTVENAPHMTAREVGALAKRCRVKKLLCTHIWAGGYDERTILDEVREDFPRAAIAEEMKTYTV